MKLSIQNILFMFLISVSFSSCGKNGSEPGFTDQSAGASAGNSPVADSNPSDEISEDDDDGSETSEDPADDSDEEDEETGVYSLPLNKNLVSDQCFLSKDASLQYGHSVFAKAEIRFNANGKGKYSYRLYSDEGCEEEIDHDHLNFSYSITKTYDRVLVVSLKEEKKKGTHMWLTIVPVKSGIFMDLDYAISNCAPYSSEPGDHETRGFSENAEKIGVFFTQ